MNFRLGVARDERQIRDALELRFRVYREEGLIGGNHPDALTGSAPDFSDRTTHLLVYADREAVGTLRLTGARSASEGAPRELGFEIEASFVLDGFGAPGIAAAEVTRFCVLRRCRGSRATALLYGGLLDECARRGFTHLLASANMQTDSVDDAALAYRTIANRRWIDARFRAVPRLAGSPPSEPRRRLYTDEQRGRSLEIAIHDTTRVSYRFAVDGDTVEFGGGQDAWRQPE